MLKWLCQTHIVMSLPGSVSLSGIALLLEAAILLPWASMLFPGKRCLSAFFKPEFHVGAPRSNLH